jgi:hypothetical protein
MVLRVEALRGVVKMSYFEAYYEEKSDQRGKTYFSSLFFSFLFFSLSLGTSFLFP